MVKAKHELVQVLNPISKHWVLIDKTSGQILKRSRTSSPYKNITIISKGEARLDGKDNSSRV